MKHFLGKTLSLMLLLVCPTVLLGETFDNVITKDLLVRKKAQLCSDLTVKGKITAQQVAADAINAKTVDAQTGHFTKDISVDGTVNTKTVNATDITTKTATAQKITTNDLTATGTVDFSQANVIPPTVPHDLDRAMALGTGELATGHGKIFNVPARGEAYEFYMSGIANFVDTLPGIPNGRFGALAQHQIQSNRNLFKWETPRENVQILASRPISTLVTDTAFASTSDNWALSMSANQRGSFVFGLTPNDGLMFDAPGFFSAAGSTGYGVGRFGDITDIEDPITGYKLRLWCASIAGQVAVDNFNPQDYNPGPASFGGDPAKVADFVLGIDSYVAMWFEDNVTQFFRSPEAIANYVYYLGFQDGSSIDFPNSDQVNAAVSNGLLYYYDQETLPFTMSYVGDPFLGTATFSLFLTGARAFEATPIVTHIGVQWINPGQMPAGGYQDTLKNGTYNPEVDYNPFRTGDAIQTAYGSKRLFYQPANGPRTFAPGFPDGLPNNTFATYETVDAATKVRSYTIGTTINGVHVFTHDLDAKPMNAKLLHSFPTPSVVEAVPTGRSTWHDVKVYQAQTVDLLRSEGDAFEFVPLHLYTLEAIYEEGGQPRRVTAIQFLSKETSAEGAFEYRFKSPFPLDGAQLKPTPLLGANGYELRIRINDGSFFAQPQVGELKSDLNSFYATAESIFAGLAVFDLSSLRTNPDVLTQAALVNNAYGNIQAPGSTLNSGVTIPVSYVSPYAFNQIAQNTRFNGDSVAPDYQFTNCHNLYVDEVQGRIYGWGTTAAVPVAVFDIKNDPLNPKFLGSSDEFYVHDGANTTYNREEALRILGYVLPEGQETLTLGIAAAETAYYLIDWTGKLDYKVDQFPPTPTGATTGIFKPRVLASVPLKDLQVTLGYAHNAWFTTDKRYAVFGDELVDQSQPYGTLESDVWNNYWIGEPRYNSQTGLWTLSSAQHVYGETPAKVHNSYFVNQSQEPFEDWLFSGIYKGGLRIDSYTYKPGFPINYSLDAAGNVTPASWQNGGPGGPNSNPFNVVPKGNVVSDPYEPRTGATPAFTATWSVTPYTLELDTPASERLIIFDDGQNINWGRYQFGNTNPLTPPFDTLNNKIRLLSGATPVKRAVSDPSDQRDRALTTYEYVGATSNMVSTEDGSLFKSPLYPGLAVGAAPDLDLRFLVLPSTYTLENYRLPDVEEMPRLATERPAVGETVYVMGPADKMIEGTVITPYASEMESRAMLFQDDEARANRASSHQLNEFTRKSEMLISIAAAPGFSGKPVFNKDKEIVGIIRDMNVHGNIVGVIGADVIKAMNKKTLDGLDGYWVQTVDNAGSLDLSIHDVYTDPATVAADPKPLAVYKDVENDIVYGFLNTLSSGLGSSVSFFIDPVSIIKNGNGTDPDPLTPFQLMGRFGAVTGTSMAVDALNPATGSFDYPSSVGYRFDGYIEPYRLIPLQNYTPGSFVAGEVLTGVVTDANSPFVGEVRSKSLYIKDVVVNGQTRIQVYPIILDDVSTEPYWRVPAGKDTSLFMNTGELLTGAKSGTEALVVDGFVATDADAVSPMPVWSRDANGVFDPTKALFRRLYAKSAVDLQRFLSAFGNAWYKPEESFFHERLSWYQQNATPAVWFSTKTVDTAEGISSTALRPSDRVVLGLDVMMLDPVLFSHSVNQIVSSKALTVFGLNFAPAFDWSADPRIIDTHVMVIELDVAIEAKAGEDNRFQYADIIYGWKLCDDTEFRDFNTHTWFADTASLKGGTCIDVQVLRYNFDTRRWTDELVLRRTLENSTQNPLHTI